MRTLILALAFTACLPAYAGDFPLPLNDLGTGPYLWGLTGGLYENGSNAMAADHFALGLAAAAKIEPLDAEGRPSPNGKIAFLAAGYGETMRIMQAFMDIAKNDVRVDHTKLVLVNAARDGADYRYWT